MQNSRVLFTGYVDSRSSSNPDHVVPGETEIQALNLARRKTVLARTCWPDLASGSLNLSVDNSVLTELNRITPLWVEDCRNVVYPTGFEHIPEKRVAYYYYLAEVVLPSSTQEVLVRKAWEPVLELVELLAPVNLRDKFMLENNDPLEIEVGESNNAQSFCRCVTHRASCIKQLAYRILSAIKLTR